MAPSTDDGSMVLNLDAANANEDHHRGTANLQLVHAVPFNIKEGNYKQKQKHLIANCSSGSQTGSSSSSHIGTTSAETSKYILLVDHFIPTV